MKIIDFGQGKCEQVRQWLDAYLSNELLVETSGAVSEHLERCPACAAEFQQRKALRDALRRAVANQPVPEGLAGRIRLELQAADRTPRRWIRWGSAAAAVVLFAAGVGGGRAVRERYLAASAANEHLLKVGTRHHIHCALHYEPKQAPSEPGMREALGEEYYALLGAVRSRLGDFEIKEAHRCEAYERRFVHLILRRGEELVSVSLTRREAGEKFEPSLLLPVLRTSGIEMHSGSLENLGVTGFEVPGHLAFVISSHPGRSSQVLATKIAGALREVAEKAPRV